MSITEVQTKWDKLMLWIKTCDDNKNEDIWSYMCDELGVDYEGNNECNLSRGHNWDRLMNWIKTSNHTSMTIWDYLEDYIEEQDEELLKIMWEHQMKSNAEKLKLLNSLTKDGMPHKKYQDELKPLSFEEWKKQNEDEK